MKIINQLMEKNHINMKLRFRIREYLKFIWKEEKSQFDDEEEKILNYLPKHLHEEFLVSSYGEILLNNPVFLTNFSKKSLNRTVFNRCLKKIRFTPGDIIFNVFFKLFFNQKSIFLIKGRR